MIVQGSRQNDAWMMTISRDFYDTHMMDLWREEFGFLFYVWHVFALEWHRISGFVANLFYNIPSSSCVCAPQNGAELVVVRCA